jgi:hypothetical protein
MYFDDCDIPQELSKKISEFLKIATGRRINFGPGKPTSGSVSLIDRNTDETLRQAYAEARNVAKRFCKLDNNLPPLPDVEVLPLKGLISISSWCRSITQYNKPVKPAEKGQGNKDTKRQEEGMITPKPPELFQNILWMLKYGKKHWKIIALAVIILGVIGLLKIVLSNKKTADIQQTATGNDNTQAVTTGDNSPIIGGDYVAGNKTVNIVISDPALEAKVKQIANEQNEELSKQYPTAHTVFGIYRDRDVVPMGLMPENLEIEWNTGQVQSIDDNMLMVKLPNMVLNGKSFVGGNTTFLEKRIGAKSGSIIQLGWFNPILKVIGIDDELVVVALGFPADDSKK